jgi:hypothetical protein
MLEREKRNAYRVLVGNLKERNSLEDLSVDGTVILKWALKEHNGMVWNNLIWLKTGKSGGLFSARSSNTGILECEKSLD